MEDRHRRGVDLWTDIAASDGIAAVGEESPALQRLHIVFVEVAETRLGELGGRAQLACTKTGERQTQTSEVLLDPFEAFCDGRHFEEAHTLDAITVQGAHAPRILEYAL